jgi:endosialidase-like protein
MIRTILAGSALAVVLLFAGQPVKADWLCGPGGGGGHRSDIRLKQDIVPLGRLNNGLELYRFRYKGSDRTTYVGVMAQEVQEIEPSAVWRDHSGYLVVNYDRIGVKFMTWKGWLARTSRSYQSAY